METLNSRLGSLFTRTSIKFQQDSALKVVLSLNKDVIYVFDETKHFQNADDKTYNGIRYKQATDGKIALLSIAAQQVFPTFNTYNQFSDRQTKRDSIGLYLTNPNKECCSC